MVDIVDSNLSLDEAMDMLKRLDLKASLWLIENGKTVRTIEFDWTNKSEEEVKKLNEKALELRGTLTARGLKLRNFNNKKEYAVKFGLDDIKVLDKQGESLL